MIELSGYIYHASARETFDSISLIVYGDERYASDLLSANPELDRMYVFRGDEELYVPLIEQTEIDGSPVKAPWKE